MSPVFKALSLVIEDTRSAGAVENTTEVFENDV
jgi:hypothetical protein